MTASTKKIKCTCFCHNPDDEISGMHIMPCCDDGFIEVPNEEAVLLPLPCPFCGTEAFVNRKEASYIVMCPSCITVQICSIEKDTAITLWNKRKTPIQP